MLAITISNLTVAFGEKTVLNKFSHCFKDGITCLFGASGRGKTTLLRTIAGLIEPQSGSLAFSQTKRISITFQEDRLLPNLSAVSNIRLVCPKASAAEIENALTASGLGESLYQPIRELSGGMKRRVALIRSLLYQADTYLFDEPFAGLDAATVDQLLPLIKKHCGGKTVIIASHNEGIAAKLDADILRI